jgi:hypothetical protein
MQIKYTSVKGVLLLFGQVITTVCSSADLVGSVSSLCVWRCGHLLVLLLSGGEVQRSPLYRLLPHTGLPWLCPGCTGPASTTRTQPWEALLEKRTVDLLWSPAQLPDLVEKRGKAQNGLHTLLWPNLWPRTSNQRLKCNFHRAWSLPASLQGVEYVLEGGGRGPCPGCSDEGGDPPPWFPYHMLQRKGAQGTHALPA